MNNNYDNNNYRIVNSNSNNTNSSNSITEILFSNKINISYLIVFLLALSIFIGSFFDAKLKSFTDYIEQTIYKSADELSALTTRTFCNTNTNPPVTSPVPSNTMTSTPTVSTTNSVTAKKTSWCLVGQDGSNRGCIEVKDAEKCLSGQIFPSQQACLRPTLKQS